MNINIVRAETKTLAYSVVLQGGKGEEVDLSAITAKIMVKKNLSDPDSKAILVKEHVHPESNVLYYELTAQETGAMKPGRYFIDFKLFYDSGAEVVLRQDVIIITEGVFNG